MCLPLAAVAVGLTIAASAASVAQARAQAEGQQKIQNDISARNASMAHRAAVEQYAGIGERQRQEAIQAGEQARKVSVDAILARSRVTAAASESGVGGRSVEDLLNDFSRQEGEFLAATKISQSFANTQAEFDRRGARLGLESRILGSLPDQIEKPNLFAQSLSAFTNAFSTGLSVDQMAKQAGGKTLFI